ncbi:MAG: type IV pilus biogenesis protein PilM [Pirellulaceae bacterium]
MAQILAIEWDVREARLAVARTRGKELTIEHAFAVSLAGREDGGSSESVAPRIAEALRTMGLGRMDTLVAIGRANIEMRQLAVPPAPDDELPEMVRFQALRQFTTIGEDWPIDFVRLATGDQETVSVLAAAMSPEVVRQIRTTCESAQLVPKRIVLRPFGAASLLRRHDQGAAQPCRLMVDLLTDEADLSVLDGDAMLLTRTVRLGSGDDRDGQSRALLGEIRRTIAAANNQLGGRRVEKLILCGDGSEHAAMKALVQQELSLEVELFDPFQQVVLGPALQAARPAAAGRFAPLLGLLLDEATSTPHALDFLHPRKNREKTDTRRRNVLLGATAASLLLGSGIYLWGQLGALEDEVATLRNQTSAMKGKIAEAEKWQKDAAAVKEFVDHSVNWLDEMQWLSERLPPAQDVIVTEATFKATPPNGAEINLEGFTRERTQFRDVDDRLRTDGRIAKSGTKVNDTKRDTYTYGFQERVVIPLTAGAAGNSGGRSAATASPAAKSSASPATQAAQKGGTRS